MSWLSKQLEKSKRKRTGIFSWGDSNYANFIDPSGSLDAQLDKLAGQSTPSSAPSATQIASMIPAGYNNQMVLYAVGAFVVYKVFFK